MAFCLEHPIAWRFLPTSVLIFWSVLFIIARLFAYLHLGLDRLLTSLDTFLANGKPSSDALPQENIISRRPNVLLAVPTTVLNTNVECRSSAYCSGAIQKPYNCTLGCTKQNKYYAIARGRVPHIYRMWAETNAQVFEFSGALHKSFKSLSEAEAWQEQKFIAMGMKWRKKDMGPEHRQKVNFLGMDEQGHDVGVVMKSIALMNGRAAAARHLVISLDIRVLSDEEDLGATISPKYDDLSEQAFYMVGGIEEVIQKAERLAKEAGGS